MHRILFIISIIIVVNACKNPPSFTADNPYDPNSGIYLMSDLLILDFDPNLREDEIRIDWRYPDEFLTGINVYHISPYDSNRTLIGSTKEVFTSGGFKYGSFSISYIFDYWLNLEFEAFYEHEGETFTGSVFREVNHTFTSPSLIDFADDTAGITYIYLDHTEEGFPYGGNVWYQLIDLDENRVLVGGTWNYTFDSVLIDGETYKVREVFLQDLNAQNNYAWQFYQNSRQTTYYSSLIELIPFEN